MSDFFIVLIFIVCVTILLSVFYTVRVFKQQQTAKEGLDSSIPETVQQHPYVKNPIFWAYIIGFGVLLAFIFYLIANR
ncbi:hypothetical protein [Bacillus sp. FJAT-52991]|uniref:Short-chain dehydrogenase n=1 Tax=Bacillus kandeliae TaxID=3129297 RepID=A0ABZ2N8X0_9BACI